MFTGGGKVIHPVNRYACFRSFFKSRYDESRRHSHEIEITFEISRVPYSSHAKGVENEGFAGSFLIPRSNKTYFHKRRFSFYGFTRNWSALLRFVFSFSPRSIVLFLCSLSFVCSVYFRNLFHETQCG